MTKNKQTILYLFLIFTIEIFAQNTYYEDKVSQFNILKNEKHKNIIMLGDSITDRGLWSELTNRNDITNRGINGDTTLGLLNRLEILNTNVKQIFIMIGINDLGKGKSVEYVYFNYIKIIARIKHNKQVPIVQSTLYVGSNFSKNLNLQVENLNDKLEKFCIKNNIIYINLNNYLAPNRVLENKYTNDGIHLNGLGYKVWNENINKYFLNSIKE